MRIRLKSDRIRQMNGMIRRELSGNVVEVSDAEGKKLVEAGKADRVELESEDGVEHATQQRGQRARSKQGSTA